MELYHEPANLFVAGFIGSPKMNFVAGAEAAQHQAHTIGIRPEHLTISTDQGHWKGRVGVSEHLGSDTFLHVHVEGMDAPMTVRADGEIEARHGDTVFLTPDESRAAPIRRQGAATAMKRLEGKTALITGAARGIGLAFARGLCGRGRDGRHRRHRSRRGRARRRPAIGPAAIAVEMDVTRQASIDAAVAATVDRARPHRHPDQQRGALRRRADRRDHPRRL